MLVYAEGVMAFNFGVDLLLLLATNRLCGYVSSVWRVITAALIGGLYAGACLIPELTFLSGTIWCIVVLSVVALVAFGWGMSAFRRGVVFVVLSMSLGGIALGIQHGGVFAVFASVIVLLLMCRIGFSGKIIGSKYIPVDISYGGKHLQITALFDSGNMLKDPISGNPVLIVSSEIAMELTGMSIDELRDPVNTISNSSVTGLRLIPYHSVGNASGFMLGMKLEEVTIGRKHGGATIAFSPNQLDASGNYQALTGGSL